MSLAGESDRGHRGPKLNRRMALKRELGIKDWETLIREVRARVETIETSSGAALYS